MFIKASTLKTAVKVKTGKRYPLPRDGGYHRLVERVILVFLDTIRSTKRYNENIGKKDRIGWLKNQKQWIKDDAFWFDAYEEFFRYNADFVKEKAVKLIDEKIKILNEHKKGRGNN